jgi:hypothetical protein
VRIFRYDAGSGKVGEPVGTVWLEFEAYPEPKALTPGELREIVLLAGSTQRTADYIGASEAFVRQNMGRTGSDETGSL